MDKKITATDNQTIIACDAARGETAITHHTAVIIHPSSVAEISGLFEVRFIMYASSCRWRAVPWRTGCEVAWKNWGLHVSAVVDVRR